MPITMRNILRYGEAESNARETGKPLPFIAVCSSGRNFLQLASYIVGKMRLKCKIHHEIEKGIADASCLWEIFEKELQLQRFMGSNLVDSCICPTR